MPGNQPLPVSDRIRALRETLFATECRTCFARAGIVTRSYQRSEGEPWVLRRAKALRAVFQEMPLFIRDGELLAGQRAASLNGRSVYPEYSLDGLEAQTTPREIWDYWSGRTIADEVARAYPEALVLAEAERATGGVTGSRSGYGHMIADYEKAIRKGFRAIRDEALAGLGGAQDAEGRAFLEAVAIAAEGIMSWASRHADLAERMADGESDSARAAELRDLARICRRVPAEPATTFHEAAQSFWFTHLALHIEQFGWSISAGRLDQYLHPFYRADLDCGRMTREQGWELLLSLWIKFMENVGWKPRQTIFQNLTLGGQDTHGRDQSNELSHLCLDATVALRFNQPALSVRWHPNIDPDFWEHTHRTIAQGLGMPALFNDEVVMAALRAHGVPPEEAVGYGIVGCVEACIPGRQQGVTAGGHLNVAKALELALNEGRSMLTGKQIGAPTGDPAGFGGFEDAWDAYQKQVHYLASLDILATHIAGVVQRTRGHCPLASSLFDDCLARRRDIVCGGTRFNLPGVSVIGTTNVTDSFLAIRKHVCQERRVEFAELRRALAEDFHGQEALAQLLATETPRFGNDLPEAEELANRVSAVHADFFWSHLDVRGGRYTSGVWPVEDHVQMGHWTAATPDGRRRGMPLADGVGAAHGADRNGPTALLASVARLDYVHHWPAGSTCNIKFSKTLLGQASVAAKVRDLVTTYLKLGGQQVQVNVVDAQTLRDAQARPERYPDLIVRVAGFSAYFTTLGRDVQDEIILRTTQEC